MENKNLNEKELEKVAGGQAVLPLKGTKAPEAGEPEPVSAAGYHAYCSSCKMYFSDDTDYCPRCGHKLMKPFV